MKSICGESTDTCYIVDEPPAYYAKKPDTKRSHIVRFHLYEIPKTGKFIETESRLVVAMGWGEGK